MDLLTLSTRQKTSVISYLLNVSVHVIIIHKYIIIYFKSSNDKYVFGYLCDILVRRPLGYHLVMFGTFQEVIGVIKNKFALNENIRK